MPRLKNLPHIDIIRMMRGVVDYYVWRGIPCARSWPRMSKAQQTEATKAAAQVWGDIQHAWSILAPEIKAAYYEEVALHSCAARDVYISTVYGKFHGPMEGVKQILYSHILNELIGWRDCACLPVDPRGFVKIKYIEPE